MNKHFIIFALITLTMSTIALSATPESSLLQIFSELASLTNKEINDLQKDPKAIRALAQAFKKEHYVLCPKEIEPLLKTPEIFSLVRLALQENN